MPVNFNSVHFQSFVDFARQRFDAGDKTAENKLPSAQKSFAKEFRFTDMGTSVRVGLKATIH